MHKASQQRTFPFMTDQVNGPIVEKRKATPSGWVGSNPYWNCAECNSPVFNFDEAKLHVPIELMEEVETGSVINDQIITQAKQNFSDLSREWPEVVDKSIKSLFLSEGPRALVLDLQKNITIIIQQKFKWLNDIYKAITYLPEKQHIFNSFETLQKLLFLIDKLESTLGDQIFQPINKLNEEDKTKITIICKEDVQRHIEEQGRYVVDQLEKIKGFKLANPRDVSVITPICDKCYNESAYECEHPDCDFATLDENEIIEVETKHWDPKKGQYIIDTKHLCDEHGDYCEQCGEALDISSEENLKHENDWYHSSCFYEHHTHCTSCGETVEIERTYYDEDSDDMLCETCYTQEKSIAGRVNYNRANNIIFNIMNRRPNLYPIDKKVISGNILPVLELANKKFTLIDERSRSWIIGRIQRSEAQAAVNTELNNNDTIQGAIETFKGNIEYQDHISKQYPNLKGFRPIPVDITVEKSSGHGGGLVFAIRPNYNTLEWAEQIKPGAKEAYKRYLSILGHHAGALGYARMSEDDGKIIIDNLQTDLDAQVFVRQKKDLESAYNNQLRILNSWGQDSQHIEPETQKLDSIKQSIETYQRLEPAINWWVSTIKKFWASYLLDIIKEFSTEYDTEVYLTSFKMQTKKWPTIPDRNQDIYEKLPEMMGMNETKIETKPEDLRRNTYNMRRVAEELFQLTRIFCKLAEKNH